MSDTHETPGVSDEQRERQDRMARARRRYLDAMHAVQTGVLFALTRRGVEDERILGDCSPKHLRTGINGALVDQGSLAGLLIRKGLIDEVEYHEAIADGAEQEKARYERELGVELA
jgi:hypothetical protein